MATGIQVDSLLQAWKRHRDYGKLLVEDLEPAQLVARPLPDMNHAAWIFCHLGAYFPVIIALLEKRTFDDPRDHEFGMQSSPVADLAAYPAKEKLIENFLAGHADVITALNNADDDVFESPQTLERWKQPMPKAGMALSFLMLAHEGIHLGQLSAWRRALGMPSVYAAGKPLGAK